jgi:hypothetical protein
VRAAAERIHVRTNVAITENGRDLLVVRRMPEMEGRFVAWLNAEFRLSERTAYNMMQAAENLGGRFAKFANIGPSALYALAAPSTPDDIHDDVAAPVCGYTDWVFDDHGLILDLKTTEPLPSCISDAHGRQGAVYAKAHGNYGMRFAYVKPAAGKKDGRVIVVYEMSADVRRHLVALHQIALRLGRFLNLSSDPHELAGLLVPDFEHFWWNHPIARSHGPQPATSSKPAEGAEDRAQPSAAAKPALKISSEFDGISVEACLAGVRAGDHWHDSLLRLPATGSPVAGRMRKFSLPPRD